MNAATVARKLGGDVVDARSVLCPGPGHSARDRSLSIKLSGDDFTVHSFAGDDWRACKDYVRKKLGLDGNQRREPRPNLEPTGTAAARHLAALPPTDRILAILRLSRPVLGMPAEKYLISRGLDLELANPEALRFLPAIGRYPPTLVSVITAFTDASQVLSLQFTPIKPDGSRGQRTFLRGARVGGGVVRLVEDAEVVDHLGIGEGTETCLAVMTAMKREGRMILPVWSALNAGNMGNLPVVPGIERLTIYVDADEPGRKSSGKLAARWHQAGREVFTATPSAGDWNEVAA
jgi:hypothetical protein